MSQEMMNTKEVARYLGIHEKQVYFLIREKRIPATRVTGKWVFPKEIVDDWIRGHAQGGYEPGKTKGPGIPGAILASGSNDPVLDVLQSALKRQYPELSIFSANTGSSEGLHALNKGYTDIAWSHLLDEKTGRYNVPFLASYLPDRDPVVVNLFNRDLGFVTKKGNPLNIRDFPDLIRDDVTFINRQAGAGTRLLLDHHLQSCGISGEGIRGYDREVWTHFEVGISVLSGNADIGIATAAVSALFGLDFLFITHESFDMIMDKSLFFTKAIHGFIDILGSPDFRTPITSLANYDFSSSGKIVYANC